MAKQPGNPTDHESFLTWEALVAVLSYDPATGEFRWVKTGRLGWVGRIAGTVDTRDGYRRVEILGRSFYASRLAFLYMKKRWPKGLIDHKNGSRADDRWINLREASRIENSRNRRTLNRNNKSGAIGVYWHKSTGKWAAQIRVNDQPIHLGCFDTVKEAAAARQGAEVAHFGEFRRDDAASPAPAARESERIVKAKDTARYRGADFESFLTPDILRRVLSYDPATGEFRWRSNETNPRRIRVGAIAGGAVSNGGYLAIYIMGHRFLAHRLAWLYMKGTWPSAVVDHINQDKQDNCWENLRAASASRNAKNVSRSRLSATGERNVYRHGAGWRVSLRLNGKVVNIGSFPSLDDAVSARDKYLSSVGEGDIQRSA